MALCGSHGVDGEVLSEARCEDLGFTGLALCSDCDSLAEYVKHKGAGALPFRLVWICLRSNPEHCGSTAKPRRPFPWRFKFSNSHDQLALAFVSGHARGCGLPKRR